MKKVYCIILLFFIIVCTLYKDINKHKRTLTNITEYYTEFSNKQSKFKKTLEDMADILEENNIKFFLFCGTALGAHREKKFIEHDNDIDIGFFSHEHNITDIANIVNKSKKFKLVRFFPIEKELTKNTTELTFNHNDNNVHIDIFMLDKMKDKYVHYSYNSICDNKKNKRCEFINPINLENILFLNKNYKIPKIDFLISHYGDDWKIPQKFSYSEGLKNKYYKSLK